MSLLYRADGDVAEISGVLAVQNLPASGSSSEVRAHQMARKLRGAGFTPHFHAEFSSNGYVQWKRSMESFTWCSYFVFLPRRSIRTIRGRWYKSVASAGVQPRTPFPSFRTYGLTLRRLLSGSGLSGGFRQAMMFNFVVSFEVYLALVFQGACLAV